MSGKGKKCGVESDREEEGKMRRKTKKKER